MIIFEILGNPMSIGKGKEAISRDEAKRAALNPTNVEIVTVPKAFSIHCNVL